MNRLGQTNDRERIEYLLNLMFKNMTLASFSYRAGFELRFEREGDMAIGGICLPNLLTLYMRSEWWLNEREQWMIMSKSMPLKDTSGVSTDLLKAATLMMLKDSMVSKISIGSDRLLTIDFSNRLSLHIEPIESVFDESWIVESEDMKNHECKWSIVCDSDGELFGNLPEALILK